MDKIERYELGIDKIIEEMHDLQRRLDDGEFDDKPYREQAVKGKIDGFATAWAYLTAERIPVLKNKKVKT